MIALTSTAGVAEEAIPTAVLLDPLQNLNRESRPQERRVLEIPLLKLPPSNARLEILVLPGIIWQARSHYALG